RRSSAATRPQTRSELVIFGKPHQCACQRGWVIGWHEKSILIVARELRYATSCRGNRRDACSHCLQQRDAECFTARREREGMSVAEKPRYTFAIGPTHKVNTRRDAECTGASLQCSALHAISRDDQRQPLKTTVGKSF